MCALIYDKLETKIVYSRHFIANFNAQLADIGFKKNRILFDYLMLVRFLINLILVNIIFGA